MPEALGNVGFKTQVTVHLFTETAWLWGHKGNGSNRPTYYSITNSTLPQRMPMQGFGTNEQNQSHFFSKKEMASFSGHYYGQIVSYLPHWT